MVILVHIVQVKYSGDLIDYTSPGKGHIFHKSCPIGQCHCWVKLRHLYNRNADGTLVPGGTES